MFQVEFYHIELRRKISNAVPDIGAYTNIKQELGSHLILRELCLEVGGK